MNMESPLLIVDEPVEVQDFMKLTDHLRGVQKKNKKNNLWINKENLKDHNNKLKGDVGFFF